MSPPPLLSPPARRKVGFGSGLVIWVENVTYPVVLDVSSPRNLLECNNHIFLMPSRGELNRGGGTVFDCCLVERFTSLSLSTARSFIHSMTDD